MNPDGTNLAADVDVGFINYPGCMLFSQVDVMLGDRLITYASHTYPYRAIFECLLNYGKDTLNTQSGTGLFCKDTLGEMDNTLMEKDKEGLVACGQYRANSHIVELRFIFST